MSLWFQQFQSPFMMNQMALTHDLISGTFGFGTHSPTGEHYSPQILNSQKQIRCPFPRPDSSCSLNSNSSMGREVEIVPPIHNRNYQESRYKTELCRHYEETGECPHGLQCLFAHGQRELIPFRGRHRKFKTQLCKAFHSEGFCSFGPRCSYIHSKPDPQSLLNTNQAIIPDHSMNANPEFPINVKPVKVLQNNGCRLSVFSNICEL